MNINLIQVAPNDSYKALRIFDNNENWELCLIKEYLEHIDIYTKRKFDDYDKIINEYKSKWFEILHIDWTHPLVEVKLWFEYFAHISMRKWDEDLYRANQEKWEHIRKWHNYFTCWIINND